MLNFIRKTLLQADQGGTEGSAPAEERTRIAAIVILLEAAHADHECSEEEMEHIIVTVRDQYGLSGEEAGELLELAHRERSRAVDLFEFTSHINDAFTKNEKKAVLETVWRIIYIDVHLEKHEDHFARKLTHLLRLSHSDMINAKLKARKTMQ